MNKSKAPQKKAEAHSAAFPQLGEFRVLTLREVSTQGIADNPEHIADYYRKNIATDLRINADVETLICLPLNNHREILGHYIVATGTLNTLLCHPREIFRAAIVANAAFIVIIHNHPSGNPMPSEADIKVTRDLIRAGTILSVDVLDHIIMGRATPSRPRDFCSLREQGYFYDNSQPAATAPQTSPPKPKKTASRLIRNPKFCAGQLMPQGSGALTLKHGRTSNRLWKVSRPSH